MGDLTDIPTGAFHTLRRFPLSDSTRRVSTLGCPHELDAGSPRPPDQTLSYDAVYFKGWMSCAAIQGFAPSLSPLRPVTIAGGLTPVPSMGFVPLQGLLLDTRAASHRLRDEPEASQTDVSSKHCFTNEAASCRNKSPEQSAKQTRVSTSGGPHQLRHRALSK